MVTPRRRRRIEEVAAERTRYVALLLDGVHDPHNVAAVLRSADAFGVQEVHAIEADQALRISRRVARGTDRWVDLYRHPAGSPIVTRLQAAGYHVWVAAAEPDAVPLEAWTPAVGPTLFVFGNEHLGVSPELRELADAIFAIPMVGMVESLNISVACALTLHHARRSLERSDVPFRLDAEARAALVARWLAREPTATERIA